MFLPLFVLLVRERRAIALESFVWRSLPFHMRPMHHFGEHDDQQDNAGQPFSGESR
ncbi:MAG: hypothetical protein ACI9AQ_002141 [Dinoroseobacter sp.]